MAILKSVTNTLIVSCSCAGIQKPLTRFVDKRRILTWGKVDMLAKPGAVTVLAHPKELTMPFFSLVDDIRLHIEASADSAGKTTIKRLIIVNHPKCKFRKGFQLDDEDFRQTDELQRAKKFLLERAAMLEFDGVKDWRSVPQKWIVGLEILLFEGRVTKNGLVFWITS